MDASTLSPRNSQHVRSKSEPSNPHPIISQVDEQLRRLRDSEATSSSLCHRLGALQDLYDCVDKLLVLPNSRQALAQGNEKEVLDDLLEGSLMLLDLCDTAKNGLLQTRECAHELESIMRRRRGEICTSSSLQKSRKMIKKTIHKDLKGMEGEHFHKVHGSLTIVNLIKEVEVITYHSMESLLSFIAGPKLPSKWSCWSSVSKLVQPKRVASLEKLGQSPFLILHSMKNNLKKNPSKSMANTLFFPYGAIKSSSLEERRRILQLWKVVLK